ncbi:methionyl-tRNA formyltransferase [bacterium]|nr:methionyl-tRNA formyltransferase [bacterium]
MEKLNNKKLRIIFAGIPDMAYICLNNLLNKKFDIVGVIPPRKTQVTSLAFKKFAKYKGMNLIEFQETPNEPACIEKIKALNADIGVVCAYDIKFTKEFLNTTKMGYLNCHPSLLPDYRGAMPYFHIIKNGETKSGVTIHYMDENFDTGDIICQKEFEILPWETMGTLFNRTNHMLSDTLAEVLWKIQAGLRVDRIPQDRTKPYKKAPKVEGNFRINWNKNVSEISNLIRACNPFYGAVTYFRNTNVKILRASAIECLHESNCGQIADCNEERLFVAAKDGIISVEVLQVGTWGIFSPKEFYHTFTPTRQEYFM